MTNETKAVEKKINPVDAKFLEIFSTMQRRKERFEDLLPPWMPPERFIAGAKMAVSLQPELLQCTPESLVLALYKAARAGIDVSGGFLGHGALVKYGNEATFQPMYRGLVALAVVTKTVQDMTPVLVHENDHFVPHEGNDDRLEHIPFVMRKKTDKRGEVIAAYTRVLLPSGAKVIKGLLYLDDLMRIEASVKARNSPWNGPHRPEMQKKSTLKNAFKSLGTPSSDQAQYLNAALQADAEADGYDVEGTVVSSVPIARGTARLKALAAGSRAETLEMSATPDPLPVSPPEPGSEG
jgi:phage RecT family recombinase